MIAYMDCFSGISGDMTLGAFIDLGVPAAWLESELKRIPLNGFQLETSRIRRMGLTASDVYVRIDDDLTARNYRDIRSLIENSPFSDHVKCSSLNIFKAIALAEAEIHGCDLDHVHFHEVGGVDAIVDIIGAALCIEHLDIKRIVASEIPLGRGFVTCSHGRIPVPAPATLAILKGIPVYGTGVEKELVTPTGAAIVASLAESFGKAPPMAIEKTGYGAGKRELPDRPNLLRIVLGRDTTESQALRHETLMIVEACIDDMNPEILGYAMESLFEDGALDVYFTPVYMKKNRPGAMISALCRKKNLEKTTSRILSETGSLGVRYYEAERRTTFREVVEIETRFGKIKAKRTRDPQGAVRIVPEYEECKKIAQAKGIPIRAVYETVYREAPE